MMTRSQKIHFKLKCSIPVQEQWCTSINQSTEQMNNVSMGNAAHALTNKPINYRIQHHAEVRHSLSRAMVRKHLKNKPISY